jgi:magnesium-transporting ATPase (P-type)
VSSEKIPKSKRELWNEGIALGLIVMGGAVLALQNKSVLTYFSDDSGLLNLTFLNAMALGGGMFVLLVLTSLILQIIAWTKWLRTGRRHGGTRPPIWTLFVLIFSLMVFGAPMPPFPLLKF